MAHSALMTAEVSGRATMSPSLIAFALIVLMPAAFWVAVVDSASRLAGAPASTETLGLVAGAIGLFLTVIFGLTRSAARS